MSLQTTLTRLPARCTAERTMSRSMSKRFLPMAPRDLDDQIRRSFLV